MRDTIYRDDAIKAIAVAVLEDRDELEAIKALPSVETVEAVKDCRNCRHGGYNDHWKTWFCYNNRECSNWDLWEPAEAEPSLKAIKRQIEEHWYLDPPSADAVSSTSKGICAVCERKQVCKDGNRNLDMIACSRFELDTRYDLSAEAENESCCTCKYFETSHKEYPCSDCTVGNSHYVSAETI